MSKNNLSTLTCAPEKIVYQTTILSERQIKIMRQLIVDLELFIIHLDHRHQLEILKSDANTLVQKLYQFSNSYGLSEIQKEEIIHEAITKKIKIDLSVEQISDIINKNNFRLRPCEQY